MDNDYVLGTDDDELARLGLQHAVWRADAHAAWQRAGITAGHTVLDIGCGPGFATADLAALVTERGRVVALDRSRRFLDAVAAGNVGHVDVRACDLDRDDLPVADGAADAAWARWVFCFVARPRDLLARVARALRPGGVFVAHEYLHYATWRASPRAPELVDFVTIVERSWRRHGGEPDIALELVAWLGELGFDVTTRAILDVVTPEAPKWRWMSTFGTSSLARLVALGELDRAQADAIAGAWQRLDAQRARLVTPAVLEIVARRRGAG